MQSSFLGGESTLYNSYPILCNLNESINVIIPKIRAVIIAPLIDPISKKPSIFPMEKPINPQHRLNTMLTNMANGRIKLETRKNSKKSQTMPKI